MIAFLVGRTRGWIALAAVVGVGFAATAQSDTRSALSLRDSFRIGDAGALCTAQYTPMDGAAKSMFDRAYAIVCRDAATRVGNLYALRTGAGDDAGGWLAKRSEIECAAPAAAQVDGVAGATVAECKRRSDGLPYRVYFAQGRGTLYIADGLRGYDSALSIGLRSLVADRSVPGRVEVAITEAGDPTAFARVQAGTLNPAAAAAAGLGRNNAGSYAEASEFFDRLLQDGRATAAGGAAENLLNYGLQQSNLGNYPLAELSFEQAAQRGAGGDIVLSRLLRNYRAIDQLNRNDMKGAIAALDAPIVPVSAGSEELAAGQVTAELAERINRETLRNRPFGGGSNSLSSTERASILDGQGLLLRGVAQRRAKQFDAALGSLADSRKILQGVRGGRIPSTAFLTSESLAQTALIEEARGDKAAAERSMAESTRLVQQAYPGSAIALSAKARLAGLVLRNGQEPRALALYQEVVAEGPSVPGGTSSLATALRPYMTTLAGRAASDNAAVADLFAANQLFVRPGLSQTQAVLARELSGGSDEAAQLFRESLNRSRDVARVSAEVADLSAANPAEGSADALALAKAREQLASLQQDQVAIQSRLSAFPRYRVLNATTTTLADLQKALRPGEGYYEVRIVGPDVYGLLATPDQARAFKIGMTARALNTEVAALRASIVKTENGKSVTAPFDVVRARKLYVTLFGPVDDMTRGLKHLIWEADGGLLALPPNVLITDDASVTRYQARQKANGADAFDFTGVAWLGRDRDVSTAVSPRGFIDVRAASASRASQAYLGLGSNALPTATATASTDQCAWPLTTWNNPISPAELEAAGGTFGAKRSALMTGPAFSDTAVMARKDLSQYRVLHFATHGLVTAPKPWCPARPALLTSFGSESSDGLLTFREIYDLRIDADLVILSACDTAGGATVEATRDAGVAGGGGYALDGLVRAFVGAGARVVVASHWPVPDDYDATKRLILGMIQTGQGKPLATALRNAEVKLMDDRRTSHPFYWAAFAIVGDGERPVGGAPAA